MAGIGHNGGPSLEELISLSIEDCVIRTGISEAQIYRLIRGGRLGSFKLGKRRYVKAASLRALLEELTAETEAVARRGAPTPWRRGPGGRWVGRARDEEEEEPAIAKAIAVKADG
jgi:hypothetical protein